MSFLFVDRIDTLDAECARGQLDLGQVGGDLPAWLVAEAIGQLAGWIAMQRTDFRSRPVAALVADLRLGNHGACTRGGILTLEARIDRFDGRAILYSGTARCGETVVAELRRSVGPLLPLELFDDPDSMRRRAAELRAGQGPRRTLGSLPRGALSAIEARPDGSRRARLDVPAAAPFFADHFPRRAVYPATLLADAQAQLGLAVAAAMLGVDVARVEVVELRDFKVRAFTEPGQQLALEAAPDTLGDDGMARVRIRAEVDGRRVASGALGFRIAP
jgi:3-hydroxymyristoyl/3-hydroxydecanoyl-(acyl carrier protein) dehydratase